MRWKKSPAHAGRGEAKDSALLAVEVYDKPAVKFKSEGYIALMVMAWTALMHAIFLRKKVRTRMSKPQWMLANSAKSGDASNAVTL